MRFIALFLALCLVSPSFAAAQHSTPPINKIYSILVSTIDKMKGDGITSKNVRLMDAARRYSSSVVRVDAAGRISLVLVLSSVTPRFTQAVRDAGGEIRSISADWKNVVADIPFDQIENLAALDEVWIVRPLMTGTTSAGSVTSEGDSIHHAVDVRSDLNVKGDSISIGVISDGCVSWAQSKALGDLPADFDTINFKFGGIPQAGSGDEGTAMMEIVHDLAPKAEIYFYGALGGGIPAMNTAIQALVREKGCKIIVDDLTFWGEPMFEDGTVATQNYPSAWVQWAIDTGVVYVSSAGNWANGPVTDRAHYQQTWLDVNLLTVPPPPPPPPAPPKIALPNGPIVPPYPIPFDNLHDFGSGLTDPGLRVITPSMAEANGTDLVVVLQWTSPWQGANDDYDLYLYDKNLKFKVAQSINVQDGNAPQDPFEIITLTHEPYRDTFNIVINHYSKAAGAPNALLGLYVYDCYSVEHHTPQYSIWGHPGIEGAIAVGAVPHNNIANIEPYSSNGNYDVYTPAYASRPKPDVVAVDGVRITGVGPFPKGGGGRFWGTSAAAPHVAGMAGLLLSKCPLMTPAQVHSKFERTAIDLGPAGFDVTYGYGRADIERAMLEVNTAVGTSGPDAMTNAQNVPMFFATADGYAINTVTVTGGIGQPTAVQSSAAVSAGSPYADAAVVDLGCPTVRRWYHLTQNGGAAGGYNLSVTSYLDTSERAAAYLTADSLMLIRWNGATFERYRQSIAPEQVGATWKLTASIDNADLSPFFIGYLTRGISASTAQNNSGESGSTVPVTFSVGNDGNGWDTIHYRARDGRGWTLSPSDTACSLSASQGANISVQVAIPSDVLAGTVDSVWLIATSVSEPAYTDSALATVTVVSGTAERSYAVAAGWNMISVPMLVDDHRKTSLYPTAVSPAFCYTNGYAIDDTLDECVGYWLKFAQAETVEVSGTLCDADTVSVMTGWNMIGSISTPVDTAAILKSPSGIVTSRYFCYDGSYQFADSIRPGSGYWVKCGGPGSLILKKSQAPRMHTAAAGGNDLLGRMNSLTISDAKGRSRTLYFGRSGEADLSAGDCFELPPTPPQALFDARFGSQRFVERYDPGSHELRLVVLILSDAYPVTATCNIVEAGTQVELGGKNARRYVIDDPSVKQLVMDIGNGTSATLPREYALEQNYPNPFNPSTVIRYSLPGDGWVTLRVFSLLGQEVAILVNEMQKAGYREVEFSAGSLPSGVYLYAMKVGQYSFTKKMMIIK